MMIANKCLLSKASFLFATLWLWTAYPTAEGFTTTFSPPLQQQPQQSRLGLPPSFTTPNSRISSKGSFSLHAVRVSNKDSRATAIKSSASKVINNDYSIAWTETLQTKQQQQKQKIIINEEADTTYKKGLMTIGFITLLFASNSPVLHAAFSEIECTPPVLLLNAACSIVAMGAMLTVAPLLNRNVDQPKLFLEQQQQQQQEEQQASKLLANADGNVAGAGIVGVDDRNDKKDDSTNSFLSYFSGTNTPSQYLPIQAGMELGFWKFVGTVLNIYGLSLTSADHGAFLIQLTTLIVPLAQGIMGVPIPKRIWTAIALAMGGVFLFTTAGDASASSDVTANTILQGDLACVGAAVMYGTYDLRLFHWGKLVEPLKLITTKIATQTTLSVLALVAFAAQDSMQFFTSASPSDLTLVAFVTLWSGLAVNAVAPYLQVGGQQAVGPARAQILYASQPLWAAGMSWVFLGEIVGPQGLVGGAAFLSAMMLAATAEMPDSSTENQ